MKITIISVGKLKEKYLKMAVDEYSKRLGRYCKLDIIEVTDEKTPDKISITQEILIKKKEGQKILRYIKDNSYVIALEIKGETLTSENLAKKIHTLGLEGKSNVTFIIGGSIGLCENVLKRANYQLSFSSLTFPHQLMRVILLEQVYRSFRINAGEPYHK
ncbi:ribosomal RNA large subunit methyltransferase H [Vallitalea longa]|uniref:Ribosomal RNA large subunit methyltransferase H n=1 Tax=Vallitalea longa TaxID=2936439 RepID=A0A9W5YA12_9FIRM|nr:23S rRNA (pseudouridine(1915)-N(3))-methyltransferase RlmH [Vallitalea longa]GKX28676.1 ribosomal RNA large subunit methyltransferase H [Vallitalea longa]